MTHKKKIKTEVIVIRSTLEYKERVQQYADDQDISMTDLVKMGINKILPKKGDNARVD